MASWIVSVLVDRHSPGGEWSRQEQIVDVPWTTILLGHCPDR
jgi:hypothetical protein